MEAFCDFCGRDKSAVKWLISSNVDDDGEDGDEVFICDECVEVCTRFLKKMESRGATKKPKAKKPAKVVKEEPPVVETKPVEPPRPEPVAVAVPEPIKVAVVEPVKTEPVSAPAPAKAAPKKPARATSIDKRVDNALRGLNKALLTGLVDVNKDVVTEWLDVLKILRKMSR